MRTLKFRVWDKVDKKYLYPESQGFVIVPTEPSFGVTLPYKNHSNPDNIDEDCFDWADADLLSGRYELEQYTGIKDRHGKEIYEGDIVRSCFEIRVVEDIQEFYMACHPEGYDIGKVKVLGNVHENPGLLEVKNENIEI